MEPIATTSPSPEPQSAVASYTNLPVAPTRPASLTVIGVLGIIIGVMGVMCVGGMATYGMIKGDPNMQNAPKAFIIANLAMTAMSVMLSMFLIIGCVGLVTLRPWSRPMMLVFAGVDLIYDIVKFIVCIVYLLPLIMDMFTNNPPPNIKPEMLPIIRTWSIIQWTAICVLSSAYAIAVLLVLQKQNVKD